MAYARRCSGVPLTSLRLLLLLGLCTLLAAALGAALLRRRAAWRAAGSVLTALVLLVASIGAGVNRHFDLYRRWSDLLGPTSPDLVHVSDPGGLGRATAPLLPRANGLQHGTVLQVRIPAASGGLPAYDSFIYLPPQYRDPAWAGTIFPVIEAFHGSPGRPSDWLDGISADAQLDHAITSKKLPPAIVVFPPSNTSFTRSLECANTRDGLRDEDYLTVDVPHWVTSHLRAAQGMWTALGFSTGGYCALDLAVRHPDLFRRVVSLDGYGHALKDHFARNLWRDDADRTAHSPDNWMVTHPPTGQAFYLSAGTRDRDAIHDLLRTWKALTESGWCSSQCAVAQEPGGRHTFTDWRRAFLPALTWALSPPGTPTSGSSIAALEALRRLVTHVGDPRPSPTVTSPERQR